MASDSGTPRTNQGHPASMWADSVRQVHPASFRGTHHCHVGRQHQIGTPSFIQGHTASPCGLKNIRQVHPALFRGTQHPSGALDLIMWLNPVPIPVEDRRLRCPYSMAIRKSHTLGHIFAKYVLLTVFDKLRMTSGFSVTNFNIFFNISIGEPYQTINEIY